MVVGVAAVGDVLCVALRGVPVEDAAVRREAHLLLGREVLVPEEDGASLRIQEGELVQLRRGEGRELDAAEDGVDGLGEVGARADCQVGRLCRICEVRAVPRWCGLLSPWLLGGIQSLILGEMLGWMVMGKPESGEMCLRDSRRAILLFEL